MGLLDALRSGGRAIGRIPGQFTHALSRWEPTGGPNTMQVPNMPTGPIHIGYDPETMEPIELDSVNLGGFDVEVPGANITGERRTGPSRLGIFMQRILPRLADGAIAGASQPNIANGGPVDFFRAMDAGMNRAQQRDMLAFNAARQQRQDALAEAERLSRIAEDYANAQRLSRYEAPGQREPANLTQFLLRKLEAARSPEEAQMYLDRINEQNRFIRDGAGNIFDAQEQAWVERPTTTPRESPADARKRIEAAEREDRRKRGVAEYGLKEGSPELIQFIETGRPPAVPKSQTKPESVGPRRGPAFTAAAQRRQDEDMASRFLVDAGQDPEKAIQLARSKGARVPVLNMLIDHAKKAKVPPLNPRPIKRPADVVDGLSGGNQKWKQLLREGN